MAELSDKYTKILDEIRTSISNIDEKKYVEKKLVELSSVYLGLLDRLTRTNTAKISKIEENQEKIVKKVTEIQEAISNIKNDIYEFDGYDFEIVCPYCNFEFVTEIENYNKEEVKCPNCNNVIELDWEDNEKSKEIRKNNTKQKDEDDEF